MNNTRFRTLCKYFPCYFWGFLSPAGRGRDYRTSVHSSGGAWAKGLTLPQNVA